MHRLALAFAVAAACSGPSTEVIKEAHEATYQTDFATVWNALSFEVKEDFPTAIKAEDATVGYIETKWKGVDYAQDSAETVDSTEGLNKRSRATGARNLFRLVARIEPGGPPWKIVIDGEAALYRPNMTMMQPYKHGAVDEPQWVPGRIEKVRVRVHERLKQYAVLPPKEKTP